MTILVAWVEAASLSEAKAYLGHCKDGLSGHLLEVCGVFCSECRCARQRKNVEAASPGYMARSRAVATTPALPIGDSIVRPSRHIP